MTRHVTRSAYAAIYASAKSDMRSWPTVALADRLRRLMDRADGGEEIWAAIDAVSDLLRAIPSSKRSNAEG